MRPLINDDHRAQLLDNGAAAARGEKRDPLHVVKLFTLDAHATWLLTELDPDDGDTAFGLIDLGIGTPELGHVRLSVLEGIRGPRKLGRWTLYAFHATAAALRIHPAGSRRRIDHLLIDPC